jgi:hypothetical protein
MIKARPKYPMDLHGTIYINNIKKAVVICLIIPTAFPFDVGSRVDNVRHTSRFLNIIDVNSTIQVCRVLWSGFYHTGSLLK